MLAQRRDRHRQHRSVAHRDHTCQRGAVIDNQLLIVTVAALITALATGLGAVPLLFLRDVGLNGRGLATAVAAGLMLAASIALISEGDQLGGYRTVAGVAVGVGLVVLGSRALHLWGPGGSSVEHDGHESLVEAMARAASVKRAILLVGVMTVHSFAEGIGVGVAYGGGDQLGTFITAAIAVHNIPEGLAISLVLVAGGVSVWRAALWSVFSSLPQPLMAVPAYLFVEQFHPVLPVGLGLAAGAMVWMILEDLLPEAFERSKPASVAVVATLSMAAMLLFQQMLQA